MKPIKRRIHYKAYLLAFIIVIFFFSAGLFVGKYVAYQKAEDLFVSQKAISAFLELSIMKDKFFEESNNLDYCNLSWEDIWEEKVGIGSILAYLEDRLGKTNNKVIEQKKVYNDVQIKTLQLVEKINEKCMMDWEVILFFYTNDKNGAGGSYDLSERQGLILDSLYEQHKDRVKTFSFDITLNGEAVDSLKEKYDVKVAPTLVINGKKYEDFLSRYEIEKIIK